MTKKQDETQNEQRTSQSYQEMFASVEKIVSKLSQPQIDLDEMVNEVQRGYKMIKDMRESLNKTKMTIEKLREDFENDLSDRQ